MYRPRVPLACVLRAAWPGRGTAVRTPYAHQPRACRTSRVPWHRRWWVTFVFVALLAFPYLVPEASLYSPAFCRFSLGMAGWLKGGSTLWITDEVLR